MPPIPPVPRGRAGAGRAATVDDMSDERWVWGLGLATTAADGTVLDTWYPEPALGRIPMGFNPSLPPPALEQLAVPDERRAVSVDLVALEIDLDAAPASTADRSEEHTSELQSLMRTSD